MRLARNRRESGSDNQSGAMDLPFPGGRPGIGRAPVSIFDVPEELIVRRYVRWRLRSHQSEPRTWVLEGIQANAELAAILLKSVGTTVCLVLAGILAGWLAKSAQVLGGALLPAAAVGLMVAIGVPALCLAASRRAHRASRAKEQLVAHRRWPGWLMAGDALATVAGGVAFGSARLSRVASAVQPPSRLVLLAALVYTVTGLGVLGIWLLPVPVIPFLCRVLRRMSRKIMWQVADPVLAGTRPVRLRGEADGQRGPWLSGVLVLRPGTLTWVGGGGAEFDLTDSSVVTDGKSRSARAVSDADSRGPKVRVSGLAGEFELEITTKLFRSYLAAAPDYREDMQPSG